MSELETKISRLIIDSLNLEGISPEDIDPVEPLFGDGLGLDSIDALELGVAIRDEFGIRIDTKDDQLKHHFASVRNLASFIAAQRA